MGRLQKQWAENTLVPTVFRGNSYLTNASPMHYHAGAWERVRNEYFRSHKKCKKQEEITMQTIFQKAYDYILVKENDEWFLTFFTGGPVEIDICVKLNDEEIKKVSNSREETEKLTSAHP